MSLICDHSVSSINHEEEQNVNTVKVILTKGKRLPSRPQQQKVVQQFGFIDCGHQPTCRAEVVNNTQPEIQGSRPSHKLHLTYLVCPVKNTPKYTRDFRFEGKDHSKCEEYYSQHAWIQETIMDVASACQIDGVLDIQQA